MAIYSYQIYGLQMQSSRALKGLLPSTLATVPDLIVNWMGTGWTEVDGERPWEPVVTPELQRRRRINLWQANEADGRYLRLQFIEASGNIEFIIDPSARVMTIYWPSTLCFADIQSYFIGAVLGCLLRRRGRVALHASAVVRDGRVIALLGQKRSGKSTTAAALVQAGWQLLADDLAVLAFDDACIKVQPGYPRLRLWPEAASTIYSSVQHLPQVFSDRAKRYIDLPSYDTSCGTFCADALPLATVYLLAERSTTPGIVEMSPQQRVMALLFNTVGNYIVTDSAMRQDEFALTHQIAQQIPIRQLHPPDSIDRLPQLCDIIMQDQDQQEQRCLVP